MTQCLIKPHIADRRGFTLTELMIAVAITVFMMMGVYGFYNTASQDYNSGISNQNLQVGANIAMSKIIEGASESGTVYRLATAVTYMIPNGTTGAMYRCGGSAQATACNASNVFGELYYCQDSPCTDSDATARWYYLNAAGTAIIYHHPSATGTVEETIYSAPKNTTISLRFSPAISGGVTLPNDVEIDVDLSKNLPANYTNKRLATSGNVSTFVLLRNHQ